MTMKKIVRSVGVLAAAAGLVALSNPAYAAGDVYQGTGWRILNGRGIQSLSPDPYVIHLVEPKASETKLTAAQTKTAESQLRAQLKKTAAQLTAVTGTKFTLASGYHKEQNACNTAERHVITVGLKYRPFMPGNKPGFSQAHPCSASGNQSAWGGWIWVDSEYWKPGDYAIGPARISNMMSHEIGHSIGLDHANADGPDANKTVDPFECVSNSSKDTPVMCSPNGGHGRAKGGSEDRVKKYAGQYTKWDIAGLKALKANFSR
ncbi:hypothetical protein OG453_06215 [Streptomyces sp. NBC_01381]|uniref:hypothetical protein n=1 Tax=Streptomyces sp. NBC_01381 TaxID=2903845 RepID=UPI00224CD07B|nr:hypothetical protein [Streptomyces sp. NBC_01381]MCX4666260.1 hypothetical protein [Streptomyces sp. NBC_01381]